METRLRRRRAPMKVLSDDERTVLTQVSTWPRVYVRDGLVDEGTAADIVSLVHDPEVAPQVRHDGTGLSFELPVNARPEVEALERRITDLLGEANESGDTFRYRTYEPGEHHPPHVDNYRIGPLDLVATALVCLTDVDEGGETVFERGAPPLAIPPRTGRLIVWCNCLPDGAPDLLAYHSGAPVRLGVKTTITAFRYAEPAMSSVVARGPVGLGR